MMRYLIQHVGYCQYRHKLRYLAGGGILDASLPEESQQSSRPGWSQISQTQGACFEIDRNVD